MKHHRFLTCYAGLLLAFLAVHAPAEAARKARPAPAHVAKTAAPNPQEEFQKNTARQIADLKEDVYTRATWKKLQEVKQEADETASSLRLMTVVAAIVGFALGCVVTFLFVKRRSPAEENLRIT